MLIQLGNTARPGSVINRTADNVLTYKLLLNYTPSVSGHIVNKSWVDSHLPSASNVNQLVKIDGSVAISGTLGVAAPTLSTHAATKGYLETKVSTTMSGYVPNDTNIANRLLSNEYLYKAGDIIKHPSATTPSYFLRCNGGIVSKSSYGSLYAAVGDQYNKTQMTNGNGQPWKLQAGFNTTQSGDVTGWTTGTSLPGTVTSSQAVVTSSRVYLLGGNINGTLSSTVYTAPIDVNGVIGTWTTGTSLPGTVAYSHAVVTSSRVYLLGGYINDVLSATVYTAPIDVNGVIGTWTTGTSLPGTVGYSQAVVTSSRVYLLGGAINSAVSSTVYTAPIDVNGVIGTWTTGTSLPGTVTYSQAVVTSSRVYLLGGSINSANSATVYTAPIDVNGVIGTWTTGTSLPGTVTYSQAVVTSSRVYLLGGSINSAWSATVYTAPIDVNGVIGTWTTGTSLPGTVGYSQAVVTSSRVYLLGGAINSANSATVYTAPFSGGLNNYMALPAIGADLATQFTLPDLSAQDTSTTGMYSYIKT